MLTFNADRAWHPSLWPFYALRSLVLWAAIIGATFGGIYAVFGGPAGLLVVAPLFTAFVVFSFGLLPAILLALLDAAFVGRRGRPLNRYEVGGRRGRGKTQSVVDWALGGAVVSAAVLAGYAVVYLNAFSPRSGLGDLLGFGLTAGTAIGLTVGWLTAVNLNAADSLLPSRSLAQTIKRGGFVWMTGVAGIGIAAYLFYEPSLEKTLLPAALLALLGAGVVPQLVATAPTDLTQIPPPSAPDEASIPTAPSPGPTNPEGGSGEGARGDWRTAAPPQSLHTTATRPNSHSTGSTTEVVNG